MPKDTIYTKAFAKATTSLNRSFELALDRSGRVPLGHQVIDARTLAKQQAFPSVEGMQATIAMDAQALRPKPFKEGNHPPVKDVGPNPKVAAAGKVVDPTAIETFQGADNVSVDTQSGAGFSGNSILEGG
jgi:hypothetical protein